MLILSYTIEKLENLPEKEVFLMPISGFLCFILFRVNVSATKYHIHFQHEIVWSLDIQRILESASWTYFYPILSRCYVLMDHNANRGSPEVTRHTYLWSHELKKYWNINYLSHLGHEYHDIDGHNRQLILSFFLTRPVVVKERWWMPLLRKIRKMSHKI